MFGIGLPEMIVILAVALIVVGPDKLPELARSLARGVQELKRTMNQVKASLDEENLLEDVQGELKETAEELHEQLLDSETQTWKTPADSSSEEDEEDIDLTPLEERPWEKERKKEPDALPAQLNRASGKDSLPDSGDESGPSPERQA